MTLPSIVQKNLDQGRSIGFVCRHYEISTDTFQQLQLFIDPADLPVFLKYFGDNMIKQIDYNDQQVQERIQDK